MKNEFNLSRHIKAIYAGKTDHYPIEIIEKKDVKEFIRLLKKQTGLIVDNEDRKTILEEIDELAGKDLT